MFYKIDMFYLKKDFNKWGHKPHYDEYFSWCLFILNHLGSRVQSVQKRGKVLLGTFLNVYLWRCKKFDKSFYEEVYKFLSFSRQFNPILLEFFASFCSIES